MPPVQQADLKIYVCADVWRTNESKDNFEECNEREGFFYQILRFIIKLLQK
jgi:hypothetical protein